MKLSGVKGSIELGILSKEHMLLLNDQITNQVKRKDKDLSKMEFLNHLTRDLFRLYDPIEKYTNNQIISEY